MDALISIRPEFVCRIISGDKRYEYRKKIFKRPVERVFIYSSAPQKRIVGFFEWYGVIFGDVDKVWKETSKFAGISIKEYESYFNNSNYAYAIRLDLLHVFNEPVNPWEFQGFMPPQSYLYFGNKDRELYEKLCNLVQV